jgi:predicted DNA-binding transcriptional regulator AlpA
MNLLTLKQVAAKLGCHYTFVYRLMKADPAFPKAVDIGLSTSGRSRCVRWIDKELDAWLLTKKTDFVDVERSVEDEDGRVDQEVHTGSEQEVPT